LPTQLPRGTLSTPLLQKNLLCGTKIILVIESLTKERKSRLELFSFVFMISQHSISLNLSDSFEQVFEKPPQQFKKSLEFKQKSVNFDKILQNNL
jgi:hypothetical protein